MRQCHYIEYKNCHKSLSIIISDDVFQVFCQHVKEFNNGTSQKNNCHSLLNYNIYI